MASPLAWLFFLMSKGEKEGLFRPRIFAVAGYGYYELICIFIVYGYLTDLEIFVISNAMCYDICAECLCEYLVFCEFFITVYNCDIELWILSL